MDFTNFSQDVTMSLTGAYNGTAYNISGYNSSCDYALCDNTSRNGSMHEGGSSPPLHLISMMSQYSVIISGYITPFLVLITILTNSLVSVVLLKKNMRSPTNTLLLAMALSDMMTGVWPVPVFIHFFVLGHYQEYVPYEWCFPYLILSEYIPTIFHTASIWLTMALALQRYVYVCHSITAKSWCTIPNTIRVIILIYVLAIISQIQRFIEYRFVPTITESAVNPNTTVEACVLDYAPFVEAHMQTYYGSYWWFRVIAIHLIPCTSLVVVNAVLVVTMRTAQRRRQMLLKQNRKSESRRLAESNCTTAMLVTVVGVFLLVEFPPAIFFVITNSENTFDIDIISDSVINDSSLFMNFIILLSYPFNLFIFCGMSRHFRQTFKRLFVGGTSTSAVTEHSHYMSLATENGAKSACPTKDTAM